jgi:transcriptional regulator with XRE-family HTH domain
MTLKNRIGEFVDKKQTDYHAQTGKTITQAEIAIAAGISPTTFSRYTKPVIQRYDSDILERICRYFGVDIADLLYLEFEED